MSLTLIASTITLALLIALCVVIFKTPQNTSPNNTQNTQKPRRIIAILFLIPLSLFAYSGYLQYSRPSLMEELIASKKEHQALQQNIQSQQQAIEQNNVTAPAQPEPTPPTIDMVNPATLYGGIDMPNPASVYCINQGGTLTIVNETAGEKGICTLPNGTQIEEWELFRRDHPEAPAPPEQ